MRLGFDFLQALHMAEIAVGPPFDLLVGVALEAGIHDRDHLVPCQDILVKHRMTLRAVHTRLLMLLMIEPHERGKDKVFSYLSLVVRLCMAKLAVFLWRSRIKVIRMAGNADIMVREAHEARIGAV
jgi:hypothetical protein